MRRVLLAVLVLLATSCATDDGDTADSDSPMWDQASDPSAPAELDDASAQTEVNPAIDLVDDASDPAELDGTADPNTDDPTDDPNDPSDADIVAAARASFRNPLGPACADPGAIKIHDASGTTFWVACTGNGFPLYRSHDLVHWTAEGHLFSLKTKPAWGAGKWWAPEIHRLGTGFIAYFTSFSPHHGRTCIGAARADSMAGPWKDLGHPLVCDSNNGLIDPTMYTDPNGRHYLYYKTDGNGQTPKKPTILYGTALADNGVSFAGKRHALLRNTLAWEGDVVEAPWIHHRGTYYYMFYSGFTYCNDTYGVGVARSKSPLGPFVKKSHPIVASNAAFSGPGHNSIVRTGGEAWLVYHAWIGAHRCTDAGSRKLMIDPISWSGGWPSVEHDTPTGGSIPAPIVP